MTDHLTNDEIARNLVSIDAIPRAILPDGDARHALMVMAAPWWTSVPARRVR